MRSRISNMTLFVAMVTAFFAVGILMNVSASVEPSSTWTMEDGIRLEGGWSSNPSVVELSDGTYRMYYHDVILSYYPLGAVIKSALSADGLTWTRESGIRLGYGNGGETGHAGTPEVIVLQDGTYRMYFCHMYYDAGIAGYRGQILSAVSTDGLTWAKESGIRVNFGGMYDSIRIAHPDGIRLPDETYRMYYSGFDGTHYRILSAVSTDGLAWTKEGGVRIDVGGIHDTLHAIGALVVKVPDGRYIMFYTGEPIPFVGYILSAVSTDGLAWVKEDGIRIERGDYATVGAGDIIKLSGYQYRMYISADRYPVWEDRMRILSAIGMILPPPPPPPVGGTTVSIESKHLLSWITPTILITSVVMVLSVYLKHKRKR